MATREKCDEDDARIFVEHEVELLLRPVLDRLRLSGLSDDQIVEVFNGTAKRLGFDVTMRIAPRPKD